MSGPRSNAVGICKKSTYTVSLPDPQAFVTVTEYGPDALTCKSGKLLPSCHK